MESRGPEPGTVAPDRWARLRGVLDAVPDPVILMVPVVDGEDVRDFAFAGANAAACERIGLPCESLLGQRLGAVLPEVLAMGFIDLGAETLRTGQPFSQDDIAYADPDGEMLFYDVRLSQAGETVLATWRNVTDRHRAAEALADSERRYRLLAENASDFVVLVDLEGRLQWASPAAERILGRSPGEPGTEVALEYLHPDDLASIADARRRANAGETLVHRVRILLADGTYRWFLASTRPVRDNDGDVVGRVTSFTDAQREADARAALQREHARLTLVLESSRLGLWDWNMQTGEVVVNERWAEIVGYPLRDLQPVSIDTWMLLAHPDDLAGSDALIRAHARGESPFYDVECRMRHRDGHWVWVRDRGRIVEWTDDGRPLRMTGTHEDCTELKRAQDGLRLSEERFRTAMASAPVGMAVVGLDRRFLEVNTALCRLLGRAESWLLDHGVADLLDRPDDILDGRMRARVETAPDTPVVFEHRMVRSDGLRVWVQHSIGPLRDTAGAVTGFVSQFVDVTEGREARRRLRQLASRDPLTALFNRRELIAQVEYLLTRTPRTGTGLAVLFIDVDGLKEINDRHGHLVGDRVIQQVAQRISDTVRHDDVVARFGGDEFVVILPAVHGVVDAERVAGQVQAAMADPVRAEGREIAVTVSIGVAVSEPGEDPDVTLGRADAAVYRAKREGRARSVAFDPATDTPRLTGSTGPHGPAG